MLPLRLSELTIVARTQMHAFALDIRSALLLLNNHILSQLATPTGLGTHWPQEPVTLEDALGFIVPIHLELVNSWDVRIRFVVD